MLLVVFIFLLRTFKNVGAQTVASCDPESITIRDPMSGSVQCQDCLKCPAGEGLSVNCGDEISSSTPITCKPCVLGETYSSAYEAGACKDCENCGPYRETIKACTLISRAECGKCKLGTYVESMLSMCKPCSRCCNDGKDAVIPQCQVPGVPANKQCSFARSGKCGKVLTTTASVRNTHSTMLSTISAVGTSFVVTSVPNEPISTLPFDASPSRINVIVGSIFGVVFIVFILRLAFLISYIMVKRRRARKEINDLSLTETAPSERVEQMRDNNQEANVGDGNETDHPHPSADDPEETTVPVQESGDNSKAKTGIQETKLPGRHGDTDLKLYSTVPEHAEPISELHSQTRELERDTTVHVTVTVHC